MSDHYHDPADIKRLKDMRASHPPTTSVGEFQSHHRPGRWRHPAEVSRAHRVGVAVAIQCRSAWKRTRRARGCGRNARRDRRGDVRRIGDSCRRRHHAWDDGAQFFDQAADTPAKRSTMSPASRARAEAIPARRWRRSWASPRAIASGSRTPRDYKTLVAPLPDGVTFVSSHRTRPTWRTCSRVSAATWRRPSHAAHHAEARCGLWVSWPKKTSKVPTDITEDVIRDVAALGIRGHQSLRRR